VISCMMYSYNISVFWHEIVVIRDDYSQHVHQSSYMQINRFDTVSSAFAFAPVFILMF